MSTKKNRTTTPAGSRSGTSTGSDYSLDLFASQEYQDALEDVHTRFILNLPETELETADRIFFQIEQAWWFYEDWICDQNPELSLPRFKSVKPFAEVMFNYSPLLPEQDQFARLWKEFTAYKRKISNYGCILLNKDCTKLILCQVYNGKTWMLPSGKINQGEDGMTAAARETYEETGFDPSCTLGLTAAWKASSIESEQKKITWRPTLLEQDALFVQEENHGKRRVSYVCVGVPEDFAFAPVCRKEIGEIAWHPIDKIPKKTFAVIPFLGSLKRWIKKNRKGGQKKKNKTPNKGRGKTPTGGKKQQHLQGGGKGQTPKKSRNSSRGRNSSSGRTGSRGRVVRQSDDLVESGLASAGETAGWSEEDMFATNENILGRKVEYDGNPHVFAEQGFAGKQDPHAFHVVGGSFLNAEEGISKLAPPPDQSKLQPLFRRDNEDNNDSGSGEPGSSLLGLTPFFSDDGATPWGEVVVDASSSRAGSKQNLPKSDPDPGKALLNMLQGGGNRTNSIATGGENDDNIPKLLVHDGDDDNIFMTDKAITARSQAKKKQQLSQHQEEWMGNNSKKYWRSEDHRMRYEQDMDFVRQWVANLPQSTSTKHFGEFKLDADAILEKT